MAISAPTGWATFAAGANSGSGSPISATVSPPTGLSAGDMWVIIITDWGANTSSFSTPSGFTLQSTLWNDSTSGNVGTVLFYKPNCTGSETSVTITDSGYSGTDIFTGASFRIPGAATSTPFVDIADGSSFLETATTGHTTIAISTAGPHTPSAAGELVLLLYSAGTLEENSSGGITWSTPAGFTALGVSHHDTASQGDGANLAVFYAIQTTATAVAATSSTATFPGGNHLSGGQLAVMVSIYAAGGGTTTNTLNPGADTLIVSDPPVFALNYLLTESATLSDSRTFGVGPVTSDGLTLSDLAPTMWPALVLFDPLTLSEATALALGLTPRTDGITLAENLVAAQGQNGSDALVLAEIAQTALGPTIAEALSLSDVLATAQANSTSDRLTLADVLNAAQSGQLTLADSLTLSDVVVTGLLAQFIDPLTLSEALLASGLVQAVDGLTLAEALNIISQAIGATNFINAADTLTPVDSFSAAVGLLTSDPLLLADLISHTLRPSLSDALALAEALNAAQSGQLTLTDALSVSDAATVTLLASFSDPLILTEALIASGLVSALDGLTVSEAWNLVSGAATVISVYLNATDSLFLSDTFSAQTLIPALIAAIRRHFVVPNRAFHFAVPVRQTHFVVPQRSFHFIVSDTPYALPVTPGDSDNTIGSTENLLSYDIDFGKWLQGGEGLVGCSVTCTAVLRSNPTFDMTANATAFVINSAISGTKVVGTVDPHNALIGARYTLLFSATTSLGRTLTKPLQPLDCDR